MSPRRLLVVTTVSVEGDAILEQVRRHSGDRSAEVKIVAPAADIGPLEWLASDEGDARAEARSVAEETADAVSGEASVETEVGDVDPVQAIEDGLRTFSADEVILVTPPGEDANWLEGDAGAEAKNRFRVPITHLRLEG